MPTAAESLRDLLISRQIGIARLSLREIRRLEALFNRTESRLLVELERRLGRAFRLGYDPGPFTTLRVRRALQDVRELLAETYDALGRDVLDVLERLGRAEMDYMERALRRAIPDEVLEHPNLTIGKPSTDTLRQVIRSKDLAIGHPLGDYFRKTGKRSLLAKELQRYQGIILDRLQQGIVTGDPVEVIVRALRLRGVPASRRALRAIVDSSIKATMQRSRLAFLEANAGDDGPIKGYQWLSTLDLRTTPEYCVPRDGKQYDLDYQPVGHGFEWGAGPGAIHPRCRSGATAVLKSWKELGIKARELKGGTRASMDGAVPRETTAEDWLLRRSQADLERVLGKRRAAAILSGDLTFEDLYRGGEWLLLDELDVAA